MLAEILDLLPSLEQKFCFREVLLHRGIDLDGLVDRGNPCFRFRGVCQDPPLDGSFGPRFIQPL